MVVMVASSVNILETTELYTFFLKGRANGTGVISIKLLKRFFVPLTPYMLILYTRALQSRARPSAVTEFNEVGFSFHMVFTMTKKPG